MRYIVAGIGLILLGAVLGPLPWLPGTPLIGVGALFVCSASLTTARAMDIVEVRIRRLLRPLGRWLRH